MTEITPARRTFSVKSSSVYFGAAIISMFNSAPCPAAEKETPLIDRWLHATFPRSSPWDIGAEIRGRYENKENAGTIPNTDFISGIAVSSEFTLLRTRIHAGYQAAPAFGIFVEARDSAVHDLPLLDDNFDLFQAYANLGDAETFPLTARIGRQELSYGDQRFVGKADWNNLGRSFDAIRLRLENSFAWIDAFAGRVVLPDNGNFNVSNDYDNLSGIYASSPMLIPWQDTQFYFLARNSGPQAVNSSSTGIPASPATQRDIHTIGTLWKSHPDALDGWDYSAEFAFQFGSVYSQPLLDRLDQQSYGIFLNSGYTWKETFATPRLGISYEHGSGDRDPTDGKVQTFENLFGTQHKPYGLMDLVGPRNMHIPKLEFSAKPAKGLVLGIDCLVFIMTDTHDYFYSEVGGGRNGNGYGISPSNNRYVGSEIDLHANYTINSWANYQIGYGHFFTGDYIDESVGPTATDADWFYTQLTLTF